MSVLIICEKPSVAKTVALALGAAEQKDGYLSGDGLLVSWCIGHLISMADGGSYDERYKKWRYEELPILPQTWKYAPTPGKEKQLAVLTERGGERLRCRIVRLGDSRERKKRPHLVKKLNHKSIKEGIQMKQNRIFDQNSSQKARSWHYNMDTNRAEAQFADGSAIAIDCLAIEDEYGNTPAQRAELDWLLYNKPLECVQLVLSGEIEHYLSLGCDHGKLKD